MIKYIKLKWKETEMKVMVMSLHLLSDNRIGKHIKCLINEGYQVEYINASSSSESDFELNNMVNFVHIPIPFIKKSGVKLLTIYSKMRKAIKQSASSILHIHDPQLLLLAPYAKHCGKIVVYDRHELYNTFPMLTARVGTWFEKKYAKYLSGVVYVTEMQEKYNIKYFPNSKRIMVPNYQSAKEYDNAPRSVNKNDITMVYIGNLCEKDRDILLMLNVVKKILRMHPECNAIFGGSCTDNVILSKMKQINKDNPKFEYKGILKYSDVVNYTVNADIGLAFYKDVPNVRGSSPNKIFEYLISGVMVVSRGEYKNSEEIGNENAGLVFSYNDDEEYIVKKICDVIADKNKLNEYKQNSYKLGRNFLWEEVQQGYIRLYSLLSES